MEGRVDQLIYQISDKDSLAWWCESLVLHPHIKGKPAEELIKIGKPATAGLLKALDDPKRCFVAHFLLIMLWDPRERYFPRERLEGSGADRHLITMFHDLNYDHRFGVSAEDMHANAMRWRDRQDFKEYWPR